MYINIYFIYIYIILYYIILYYIILYYIILYYIYTLAQQRPSSFPLLPAVSDKEVVGTFYAFNQATHLPGVPKGSTPAQGGGQVTRNAASARAARVCTQQATAHTLAQQRPSSFPLLPAVSDKEVVGTFYAFNQATRVPKGSTPAQPPSTFHAALTWPEAECWGETVASPLKA